MRRAQAAFAGLLLALVGVVVGAPAAQAHNVLQSTDPAAGSTVPVVPEIITMTFNEPVLALGTTITVHAFDERMVNIGPPVLVDNTVSQAVTGELPAGEYTVLYRVTSADGHPIEDQFRFTAAEATSYGVATVAPTMTESPSASPTPTRSAEVTPVPSAAASAPPVAEGRVSEGALLGVAGVLVVAGGVVAWLLLRRRPPVDLGAGSSAGVSPGSAAGSSPGSPSGSSPGSSLGSSAGSPGSPPASSAGSPGSPPASSAGSPGSSPGSSPASSPEALPGSPGAAPGSSPGSPPE